MTEAKTKNPHYYKNVAHLSEVDVYRLLLLFNVTDPCIQHAVKKLLVTGGRSGGKSQEQDVKEAIQTLQRWQEMREEDSVGVVLEKMNERAKGEAAAAVVNVPITLTAVDSAEVYTPSKYANLTDDILKDNIQEYADYLFGANGMQFRIKSIDANIIEAWIERSIHNSATSGKIIWTQGKTDREACEFLMSKLEERMSDHAKNTGKAPPLTLNAFNVPSSVVTAGSGA